MSTSRWLLLGTQGSHNQRQPGKLQWDSVVKLDALSGDSPLVDELAWGHLLERHLDGGAHWRLVGRGAREIGIEIDPRVRVERHHRQVIRLIGHAAVEAAILDHDGGRDMASSLDLLPRQTGGRVAHLTGLLWRVLQPVAGGAVL